MLYIAAELANSMCEVLFLPFHIVGEATELIFYFHLNIINKLGVDLSIRVLIKAPTVLLSLHRCAMVGIARLGNRLRLTFYRHR